MYKQSNSIISKVERNREQTLWEIQRVWNYCGSSQIVYNILTLFVLLNFIIAICGSSLENNAALIYIYIPIICEINMEFRHYQYVFSV